MNKLFILIIVIGLLAINHYKKNKIVKKILIICIPIAMVLIIIWATTFVFIFQPIGTTSIGETNWELVWVLKTNRLFTKNVIPFICSPDRILLKTQGYVDQLGRETIITIFSRLLSRNVILLHLSYSRIYI